MDGPAGVDVEVTTVVVPDLYACTSSGTQCGAGGTDWSPTAIWTRTGQRTLDAYLPGRSGLGRERYWPQPRSASSDRRRLHSLAFPT